jgi:nitroreductase
MDALDAIFTRKSVRNFTDQHISDADLRTILEAGMSGPTCVMARDWSFIVIRDKDLLGKVADGNGHAADPLRGADVGILICGDLSRSFKVAPDYWIIDGAIAGQNMVIAATALGIGSVWLGTYPEMNRVENQIKLFSLPEHIRPHSVLALGYADPDAKGNDRPKPPHVFTGRYEEDRVHFDQW